LPSCGFPRRFITGWFGSKAKACERPARGGTESRSGSHSTAGGGRLIDRNLWRLRSVDDQRRQVPNHGTDLGSPCVPEVVPEAACPCRCGKPGDGRCPRAANRRPLVRFRRPGPDAIPIVRRRAFWCVRQRGAPWASSLAGPDCGRSTNSDLQSAPKHPGARCASRCVSATWGWRSCWDPVLGEEGREGGGLEVAREQLGEGFLVRGS